MFEVGTPIFCSDTVNVYDQPGISGKIIVQTYPGMEIGTVVLNNLGDGSWYQIEKSSPAINGYIQDNGDLEEYINPDDEDDDSENFNLKTVYVNQNFNNNKNRNSMPKPGGKGKAGGKTAAKTASMTSADMMKDLLIVVSLAFGIWGAIKVFGKKEK